MAYLNLDPNYFEHPKTRRLVGLLGKYADIYPIRLWCYSSKYHPENGRFINYSAQEIEALLHWDGEKNILVDSMVKVGFLRKKGNNYEINDWQEHEGHLIYFKQRGKIAAIAKWKTSLETLQKNKFNRSQRLIRARKKGKHTPEQWKKLIEYFGNICLRCGKKDIEIVKDHIMPIYQGGSDGLENLQPLCRSCNAEKGPENIDFRLKWLEKNKKEETPAKCLLERLLNACLMPPPNQPNLTIPNQPYINNKVFLETFNQFLEMRKKIRKPATERAKELILKKLHTYPVETAIAMLEQSIINSWQDVYPLKTEFKGNLKQTGLTDEAICKALGKIATKDMIKNFLKDLPQPLWPRVLTFLRKTYPRDGDKVFNEAERELIQEIRINQDKLGSLTKDIGNGKN